MRYPAQIKHQAITLRLKGTSLDEISAKLNLPKSTIWSWIKSLHLSPTTTAILDRKKRLTGFQSNNKAWMNKEIFTTPPAIWTEEKIAELKKLYSSGLSMKEVGEKMDKSLWSITAAMRKYDIPRRKSSETNNIKFNHSPLSFIPKAELTPHEVNLKTVGLMLYWGEGSKKTPDRVSFANSDPKMIKIFCSFLRRIYQPNEKRLRAALYCFDNQDTKKLTKFWSKTTNIPTFQFIRPSKPSKHGKIRFGTLYINYSDRRLYELLISDMNQLTDWFL